MPPKDSAPSDAEQIRVSTSKGLMTSILILLAGGGIGASAVGVGYGRDTTSQPTPWMSSKEIQGVVDAKASETLVRANIDCDAKVAKLEVKLAKIEETVAQISLDVATISATLPYLARGSATFTPANVQGSRNQNWSTGKSR